MKRFYKIVTTTQKPEGFGILLDGKGVKTPARADLMAPNEALANLVMREWAEQEEEIIPANMPITQILSTKIDRIQKERQAMQQTLLKYIDTDLICYHVDHPPALAQRQKDHWSPALEWFEKKHGCVLQTTQGIQALTQDEKAKNAVSKALQDMDDDRFTILQLAVSLCGSIVLPLMFIDQDIDAENLFKAIRIEEDYNAEIYNEEKYGPDPAQAQKDEETKKDLLNAQTYLESL